MKVLSFGSLNIDYTYQVDHFVQGGETLSSESLQVFSGGKGLNQSVALAKAGADVYHAGAIGEEGRFLLDILEVAGADTRYVKLLKEEKTGHAIIQRDKMGGNCILLFGGANERITKEQVDETLAGFEAGDFIILQNEISQVAYIMEQAYKKGIKIVLNPSPMNEKILQLPLSDVSYLLLNEVESQQILGIDIEENPSGALLGDMLREKFPEVNIVLTLGSQGSVYLDKEQTVFQDSYCVKVTDTTAAGDTFTGFFLAALMQGKTPEEAMNLASGAAAIAVSRPGAAPSIPTREEAEAFIRV